MQVHQFHPTVSFGDAISDHMLCLQRILRLAGYRSEIFCEQLPVHFRGRVQQIARYHRYSSPDNVLLLHFSLAYSSQVQDWLKQLPDTKVVVYHNITPHNYFAGVNNVYMETAKVGREQLSLLRAWVQAGWGDSEFNADELRANGWERAGVLPIAFEPRRYAVRPNRKVLRRWQNGVNVLFVGRCSPNKRIEDLILTFYHLKRFVCPNARLLLVGSNRGMEPYSAFLQALVKRLGLSDVVFTGHVGTSELVAYYRCASVYLSMSEHEGFGVPLLESMHFGVPIIAYKAAAVPETLGGSGVLVKTKDYPAVAELIGVLVERETLRERIVARQRKRLEGFYPAQVGDRLQALLRNLEV